MQQEELNDLENCSLKYFFEVFGIKETDQIVEQYEDYKFLCFKPGANASLRATSGAKNRKILAFSLKRCDQRELSAGLVCMDDAEL